METKCNINFTEDQIKKIKPLFDLVKEAALDDKKGAIFAQIHQQNHGGVFAECRFIDHKHTVKIMVALKDI